MGSTSSKDPNATLPWSVDWSIWATNEGEDLVSSSWTLTDEAGAAVLEPEDGWVVIEDIPPPSLTNNVATVWLSGGVDGESYRVTNTISTAAGRIDERTLRILVRQR